MGMLPCALCIVIGFYHSVEVCDDIVDIGFHTTGWIFNTTRLNTILFSI